MKRWDMIHKIKALYAGGTGSSIRAISEKLQLSRNTVRKYLRMKEATIEAHQSQVAREKRLDVHHAYIVHLLQTYPRLSAVKVLRKLQEKVGALKISNRSVRRYIEKLKRTINFPQQRYYEPILHHVPGVQCQVDPGELRDVMIGDTPVTVYFVVFVLSYSRLMYVGLSSKALNTTNFITLHDVAFRYFGGCPEECVYDQTKLVVISESYRELTLNQQFQQYATSVGFYIRACEGYDPQSKGKVESGVKYVKHNALYGESFGSWQDLECYLMDWLNGVANLRCHATTKQVPQVHYDQEERARMKPYLQPSCIPQDNTLQTRQVDKTGLISWQGNKYSVPMAFQCARVGVCVKDSRLQISELAGLTLIACHHLSSGKGLVLKNRDHYRDKSLQVAEYEEAIQTQIGKELGQTLCQRLKETSPKIYKDQLAGLKQVLAQFKQIPLAVLSELSEKTKLTVTQIQSYLEIYATNPERLEAQPLPEAVSITQTSEALAKYKFLISAKGERA